MDVEQQVSTTHLIDLYEIIILNINPLTPSCRNLSNCLSTLFKSSKVGIFFMWERPKSGLWHTSLALPYAHKSTLLLMVKLGEHFSFLKKMPKNRL
jgi:hypothetical protein